jgi:hypothetical protein
MVVEAHVIKAGHDCRVLVHRDALGSVVREQKDGRDVKVSRADDWSAVENMILEFQNRAWHEQMGDRLEPNEPTNETGQHETPTTNQ